MKLLILQERAHKAGAQYAILRTLRTEAFQKIKPCVILGEKGWLSEQFDINGINYLVEPFPSSRSLSGKILKNRQFTKKVIQQLPNLPPEIIIANDHGESLLALEIAKQFNSKTAAFLRTPGMSERDFLKYKCDRFDLILTIGEELTQRVQSWHPSGNIHATFDGIEDDEFTPTPPISDSFPTHWLIIGGAAPRKGWQDFAEALRIAEKNPDFPTISCDFTSDAPSRSDEQNNMELDLPRRAEFNFIGKVDNLATTAQHYGLCVHPSRAETFGLAAAEIIAAGIPLLASNTGILPRIQSISHMTFEPLDPDSMAHCFLETQQQWPPAPTQLEESKELLQDQFSMDAQGQKYYTIFAQLLE